MPYKKKWRRPDWLSDFLSWRSSFLRSRSFQSAKAFFDSRKIVGFDSCLNHNDNIRIIIGKAKLFIPCKKIRNVEKFKLF